MEQSALVIRGEAIEQGPIQGQRRRVLGVGAVVGDVTTQARRPGAINKVNSR